MVHIYFQRRHFRRREQYIDVIHIAGLAVQRKHFSSRSLAPTFHTKANDQTLGAAYQYSSGFESSRFLAEGLMGMASQSLSFYDTSPMFQTLVSEGRDISGL